MKITFKTISGPQSQSATTIRIARVAAKIPTGTVLDGNSIAQLAKVEPGTVRQHAVMLLEYSHKVKGRRWWGNRKTIQQLKEQSR